MKVEQVQISEKFRSIQGEGILAGLDTYFIRFQKCRVGCKWCDTKYSWKNRPDLNVKVYDLIIEIVRDIPRTCGICFTGGEPMEYIQSLSWLLNKLHIHEYAKLSVETAGVVQYVNNAPVFPDQKDVFDLLDNDVFLSISPKLSSALGNRFTYEGFSKIIKFWDSAIDSSYKAQFKFVVSTQDDLENIKKFFSENKVNHYLFLQLENSVVEHRDYEPNALLLKNCIDAVRIIENSRLTVQQHKIIGLQ